MNSPLKRLRQITRGGQAGNAASNPRTVSTEPEVGQARQPKTSGLASATAVPSNQTVEESLENLDNTSNSAKVPDRFRNPNHSAGAQDMKNVYEVLRQKEMELTRLEKEVEALRLVAPLLSEEKENASETTKSALPTAVNGPQATTRMAVPASPSIPAPQPVRAAGWEDTAKRWP
jgi:hypothetical protein